MQFWEKVRRNHGLEHAAITLMLPHARQSRVVAGYSLPGGFLVLGDFETEQVERFAQEGLERMQQGQADLAVSPFCGTNIVVAAALATLGAVVALRFGGFGLRGLNRAFSNATLALVASRPIGRFVQERYTTSADVGGASIERVTRHQVGGLTVHWVATRFAS